MKSSAWKTFGSRLPLAWANTAARWAAIVSVLCAAPCLAQSVKPPPSFKDCSDCAEMVVVPAGVFKMGSTAEDSAREPETAEFQAWQAPVHDVKTPSFAIGKYVVTRAQFAAFVRDTDYQSSGCTLMIWNGAKTLHKMVPAASWRDPGYAQTDKDPVVCISYGDAVAYVNWLAAKTGKPYRLPTEAEMEYATRAGTTTTRFWGDDPLQQCKYANGADLTAQKAFSGWNSQVDYGNGHVVACTDGYVQTAPVGSFLPNPWGLYDTLGNAFVWTTDCWHPGYAGAPTDGSAWLSEKCDQRVIRGGGWAYHPGAPHSSFRHPVGVNERQDFISIRVALSLK